MRYRGYYYDSETGLYYLQSRYYDPETGRFINADGLVDTEQGIHSQNMFAYCGNDPVNNVDSTGKYTESQIRASIAYCQKQIDYLYSVIRFAGTSYNNYGKQLAFWQKALKDWQTSLNNIIKTIPWSGGTVTILKPEATPPKSSPKSDVYVVDHRRSAPSNPNMQVRDSYKYFGKSVVNELCEILLEYGKEGDTGWNRTLDSMILEWDIHTEIYGLGKSWALSDATLDSAKHVDLDNNEEGKGRWYFYKKAGGRLFN